MAQRFSNIIPLLLITLFCVGIVEGGYSGLEYFLLRNPVKHDRIATDTSADKRAESPLEHAEQSYDYHIILERNLFGKAAGNSSVTKKAEQYDNLPKDLEATRLDIILKGTIWGVENGEDRAIILDEKTTIQDLYRQGDSVQGARIKKILRGKVVLSHNGKDEVLEMSETAGSAEPEVPVAAGPSKRLASAQKPVLDGRLVGSKKGRRSPAKSRKPETEEQPIE